MNSIPETGRPFALLNYETFAFWAYTAGVATTAFGPIAHYIGWTFALASLIYGKLRYNASLSVKLGSGSKRIMIFLVLFLIWSMFAHIPYVDSFYVWGKGASIPLEFLTGLYLAMRLINNSERRNIFGLAVVAINVVFCFDVMFRPYFFVLGWNSSLDNGNAVALYSVLTMPIFFCYAFWYYKNNILIKYILSMTSVLFIIFSFSSGGWITAIAEMGIFTFYAVVSGKVRFKSIILLTLTTVLVFYALISVFDNGPFESFKRELNQIMSVNDVDVLTNHRIDTWRASIYMTQQHPFAGSGWATFEKTFTQQKGNMTGILHQQWAEPIPHPHNMFLSILYAGGLPSLLFFVAAFVLSIKTAWVGLKRAVVSNNIPWHLICFILLVSQAIYGTNGDVFAARRDIAVIFWACWGLLLAIPNHAELSDKEDNIEDPALC